MPKKPRSEQEVQKVREEILDKTLELINEVGYENFTMRKLANKLNMTATPIYQYYKNKDELYLAALTQGFETLCNVAEKARDEGKDPMERLRFVIRDVILFGLEHPGVYNILFISAVPKYYDYVGTENEDAAKRELDAAMRFRDFLVEVASAPSTGMWPWPTARSPTTCWGRSCRPTARNSSTSSSTQSSKTIRNNALSGEDIRFSPNKQK